MKRHLIFSMYDKDYKNKSLEDNVYFTLRDIYMNCDNYETCMRAESYSGQLTEGIAFEDRTDAFEYTNVLHQAKYLNSLCKFLESLTPKYFAVKANDDFDPGMEYQAPKEFDIPFDEWWNDLQQLKRVLDEHLESITEGNVTNN
jgi:hypothetical protein